MTQTSVPANGPCPKCGRYKVRAITVDAVAVKDGNVLLVKRGHEPFKGKWALPGGYPDMGESMSDAAVRELREETGQMGLNPRLIGVFDNPLRHPKQAVSAAYLVDIMPGQSHVQQDPEEITGIGWFSLENLPPLAFDHDHIIDAALKQYWDNLRH